MSLPIVMIFERHWDTVPRKLLLDLTPQLATEGYNTYCLEASFNHTGQELLEKFSAGIKSILTLCTKVENSIKKHGQVNGKLSDLPFSHLTTLLGKQGIDNKESDQIADRIKTISAEFLFKSILETTIKHQFLITGVDDRESDERITSAIEDQGQAAAFDLIVETNEKRNEVIATNLYALKSQQKQIIFTCGAVHFNDVVAKLKQKGLKDKDLICYFPHSPNNWDVVSEMKELGKFAPIEHTYCLSNPSQIKAFGERIIKEIKSKSYSIEVPERNSHTDFLTEFFKVSFKTFLWPNYRADAQTSSLEIANQLKQLQIPHHIENNNLVIPNINTQEVAQSIRLLPYLV